MEAIETILSYLVAAGLGAGAMWMKDRKVMKQFRAMLEALDSGKVEGKDWYIVRDDAGTPTGFRVTLGASAATDKLEKL